MRRSNARGYGLGDLLFCSPYSRIVMLSEGRRSGGGDARGTGEELPVTAATVIVVGLESRHLRCSWERGWSFGKDGDDP